MFGLLCLPVRGGAIGRPDGFGGLASPCAALATDAAAATAAATELLRNDLRLSMLSDILPINFRGNLQLS
jgi:hypothetical protein